MSSGDCWAGPRTHSPVCNLLLLREVLVEGNQMSSTRDEVVTRILDRLFTNSMGQKADRLVLVTEDRSGAAKVSNARDLGGFSRLPLRDILQDAIDSALRQREQEVRAEDAKLARNAKLPRGYQWGHDAMEQFNFGKERAALAIEKKRRDDTPQEREQTNAGSDN